MVESHTFPRVIEVGGVINYSNNTCKNGQFVILEINCNIQYLKYNFFSFFFIRNPNIPNLFEPEKNQSKVLEHNFNRNVLECVHRFTQVLTKFVYVRYGKRVGRHKD